MFVRCEEVGFYSVQPNGDVAVSRDSLRQLQPLDAAVDYHNATRGRLLACGRCDPNLEDTVPVRSESMFRWILLRKQQLVQDGKDSSLRSCVFDADFVCSRNALVRLAFLVSPVASGEYEHRWSPDLLAASFFGVRFLTTSAAELCDNGLIEGATACEWLNPWFKSFKYAATTPEAMRIGVRSSSSASHVSVMSMSIFPQRQNDSDPDRDPDTEPHPDPDPDPDGQESQAEVLRVLHGAHIDCANPWTGCYADIKTVVKVWNEDHEATLKRQPQRVLRWWLEGTMGAVPDVICAFVNYRGYVVGVRDYRLNQLLAMTPWTLSGRAYFRKLAEVLRLTKWRLPDHDPTSRYLIERRRDCSILVQKVPCTDVVIPQWFVDQFAQ